METTFATPQPDTVLTPGAATAVATEEFRRGAVIAYLVLSGLVALSSLMPWMNLWFVTVSGLQFGIVGWIVLISGGYSALAAARSLSHNRAVRRLREAQFGTAFVTVVAFAMAYSEISEACQDAFMATDNSSCAAAFLGSGAKLALFAGVALGLTALFRKPTTTKAA